MASERREPIELPPPDGDPAGVERRELVAWLREERGIGDDVIGRSIANGTILLTAAGAELGTAPRYSAREIAERHGLEVDLVLRISRAAALPNPADPGIDFYGDSFLEVTGIVAQLLAAGVTEDQITSVARVLGLGLGQAAETMRQTVMEIALRPGLTERELAQTYAAAADILLPLVGPLLDRLLRLHLHNAVRTEVVTSSERQEGALPGARQVGVAFADLVGFTPLGEQVPPDQLEQVAEQLVVFASEVIEPPVRFVKSVGDAVLLVSQDAEALLDASFDLLERVELEGPGYPQLRIGLAWGEAVARAGDWFGRPVNLASRITGVARAASIVGDARFRERLPDDGVVRWSRIGERDLKGIRSKVELWRARRPSDAPSPRRSRRR